MNISVALIVRDEEQTLSRCLDSVCNAVDETIVVDTGSQDATREIAQRYTQNVSEFAWADDFSAARQFAFDQANTDWVAWLDADDVVQGAEQIRSLLEDTPSDVGMIYWPYIVAWDDYSNPPCQYWRERLVRNDGAFKWKGRVHEVLVSQSPCKSQRWEQIVVKHLPLGERAAAHHQRNLKILETEYLERNGELEPRMLYYLAREYVAARDFEKALQIFEKHISRTNWDDERYLAMVQSGEVLLTLGRYDQAIDTLFAALKLCPHWPDAYFNLAKVYYFLQDWHKVVHWCEVGRAMPRPNTLLFVNPMSYQYDWIIYFTNALFHVGQIEEALTWTQRALKLHPNDLWHRENYNLFSGMLWAQTPLAAFSEKEWS